MAILKNECIFGPITFKFVCGCLKSVWGCFQTFNHERTRVLPFLSLCYMSIFFKHLMQFFTKDNLWYIIIMIMSILCLLNIMHKNEISLWWCHRHMSYGVASILSWSKHVDSSHWMYKQFTTITQISWF